MPSISFDRVAHQYDATRGYPPGIDQQIVKSIVATVQATSETAFMEVGIGTGRIAFPLACLGHTYTGVDISRKMVQELVTKLLLNGWLQYQQPWGSLPDEDGESVHEVLRFNNSEKKASMRLALSDMTSLPFRDSSFDVVLAVHVFQLVDGWRQALREVLRVIQPGGLFLHCWDELVSEQSWPIGETWRNIVRELGFDAKRPGTDERSDVTGWLIEHGYRPQEIPIMEWEITQTPREALEQVTKRLWSSTWIVPDDIFAESIVRLESWAKDFFGTNIDQRYERKCQFIICKTEV